MPPTYNFRIFGFDNLLHAFWCQKRGFWGPLYHLVSGYGWNTVLACLLEPLMVVSLNRKEGLALGSKIDPQAVLDFGAEAQRLGFAPKLLIHRMG